MVLCILELLCTAVFFFFLKYFFMLNYYLKLPVPYLFSSGNNKSLLIYLYFRIWTANYDNVGLISFDLRRSSYDLGASFS